MGVVLNPEVFSLISFCMAFWRGRRQEHWEDVGGLEAGERFNGTVGSTRGRMDYRKTGRTWRRRYMILEHGFLKIHNGKRDAVRGRIKEIVDLALCTIQVERTRSRVQINNGGEAPIQLEIRRQDLATWLTQLENHRKYRVSEIRFGSLRNPRLTGSVVPSVASAPNVPVIFQHDQPPQPADPDQHTPEWILSAGRLDKERNEVEKDLAAMEKAFENLEENKGSWSKRWSLKNLGRSKSEDGKSTKEDGQSSTSNGKSYSVSETTLTEFQGTGRKLLASLRRQKESLETEDIRLRLCIDGLQKGQLPPASAPAPPQLTTLVPMSSKPLLSQRSAAPTPSSARPKEAKTTPKRTQSAAVLNSTPSPAKAATASASSPTSVRLLESREDPFSVRLVESREDDFVGASVTCDDIDFTEVDNEEANGSVATGKVGSDEEEESPSSSEGPLHRETLPAVAIPAASVSIWVLLASASGKQPLPISLYEPLSNLQRICEDLEYSALLDRVVTEPGALERICLVAAFAVSSYCGTFRRGGRKPFQPMLGETFHLDRWEELGWRFHAEQVVHKPSPISAAHAEGKAGWVWSQELGGSLKVSSSSFEIRPEGQTQVLIRRTSERFTFNRVNTVIHNIGEPSKRCVRHHGELTLKSSNGFMVKLTFEKGFASYAVHGKVSEIRGGKKLATLDGKWMEGLTLRKGSDAPHPLFQANALPPDEHLYYGFSSFARSLNEIPAEESLPRTDSRRRKDVRALEEGKAQLAQTEKTKLEEAQRRRRELKLPHAPLWFKHVAVDGSRKSWISNGDYWNAVKTRFANPRHQRTLFD